MTRFIVSIVMFDHCGNGYSGSYECYMTSMFLITKAMVVITMLMATIMAIEDYSGVYGSLQFLVFLLLLLLLWL